MTAAIASDFRGLIKAAPSADLLLWLKRGFAVDNATLPAFQDIARSVANRVHRSMKVPFTEAQLLAESELVTRVNEGEWCSEFIEKVEDDAKPYRKSFWIFLFEKLWSVFKAQVQKVARQVAKLMSDGHDLLPANEQLNDEERLAVQRELNSLGDEDAAIVEGILKRCTTEELANMLGVHERTIRNRIEKIWSKVYHALPGAALACLFVIAAGVYFAAGVLNSVVNVPIAEAVVPLSPAAVDARFYELRLIPSIEYDSDGSARYVVSLGGTGGTGGVGDVYGSVGADVIGDGVGNDCINGDEGSDAVDGDCGAADVGCDNGSAWLMASRDVFGEDSTWAAWKVRSGGGDGIYGGRGDAGVFARYLRASRYANELGTPSNVDVVKRLTALMLKPATSVSAVGVGCWYDAHGERLHVAEEASQRLSWSVTGSGRTRSRMSGVLCDFHPVIRPGRLVAAASSGAEVVLPTLGRFPRIGGLEGLLHCGHSAHERPVWISTGSICDESICTSARSAGELLRH